MSDKSVSNYTMDQQLKAQTARDTARVATANTGKPGWDQSTRLINQAAEATSGQTNFLETASLDALMLAIMM